MEQIDKAIQNVEQNIKNAEELFQSYLNKILLSENDGWLMTSIGKVANIVNGGTPKTSIMDYWSGDILWITPKDMGKLDSIYVSDTSRKITELGLKKSSAKLLPKNSIILSSRAPIGHLAINTEPISTNQGCKGIVPGEQIESKFLYYFLLCNVKLLNDLGVGTTFKELSMSKLSNIEISLPERDIQQKIINEIDGIKIQTEQLKNNYQNELISLKELKKSILEKAFNGEL
jgi:type I restriction enzyme S subunit